jgi:hypothetical protein
MAKQKLHPIKLPDGWRYNSKIPGNVTATCTCREWHVSVDCATDAPHRAYVRWASSSGHTLDGADGFGRLVIEAARIGRRLQVAMKKEPRNG